MIWHLEATSPGLLPELQTEKQMEPRGRILFKRKLISCAATADTELGDNVCIVDYHWIVCFTFLHLI